MADNTGISDSPDRSFKESDWMSSTPIPLCRYETKFCTEFDESLESDYKSALSDILKNPENSLSITRTEGSLSSLYLDMSLGLSTPTSPAEFSIATSLEDNETGNTDKEHDDCRKNVDFDFDEVGHSKDISLSAEKKSCPGEIDIYETSLARETMIPEGERDFQNLKFEKNSLPGQTNKNSKVSGHMYHRLGETLTKECTLKESETSQSCSNETLTSNPVDFGKFHKSATSLNMSQDLLIKILQCKHTTPRSSPSSVSNRNVNEKPKLFQPESLFVLAARAWKPFDFEITCSPFTTSANLDCDTSAGKVAEVQDDPAPGRRDVSRENDASMGEMDVSASGDSSFGLENNNSYDMCSATNESKFDSSHSDVDKLPFRMPEVSGFWKSKHVEYRPSKSNLVETTTSNDKKNKITKEGCPSVDTILGLFSIDNTLSKNILQAILSRNSTNGATYTKIIKYLRNKHIFRTKITESVKMFLQTAVQANLLRMRRNRYFLVSRETALGSQLIQSNSDGNEKSEKESLKRQYFSSRTRSKLRKENNLKNTSLELDTRKRVCPRKTRQVSPSNKHLEKIITKGEENYETGSPSVDTTLCLFSSDSNLSKNILLAILDGDFTNGMTYTKIIKCLRNKRIFSTKLIGCVKKVLENAVNMNILRMKGRRYFLVSSDGAKGGQT